VAGYRPGDPTHPRSLNFPRLKTRALNPMVLAMAQLTVLQRKLGHTMVRPGVLPRFFSAPLVIRPWSEYVAGPVHAGVSAKTESHISV
jgi:hypothetical protein